MPNPPHHPYHPTPPGGRDAARLPDPPHGVFPSYAHLRESGGSSSPHQRSPLVGPAHLPPPPVPGAGGGYHGGTGNARYMSMMQMQPLPPSPRGQQGSPYRLAPISESYMSSSSSNVGGTAAAPGPMSSMRDGGVGYAGSASYSGPPGPPMQLPPVQLHSTQNAGEVLSNNNSLVHSPEEEMEEDDPEADEDLLESKEEPQSPGAETGGVKGKKRRPHSTRRRIVQSCSECRRRKIKCDKKFPCGPCILRADEARCHEVGLAEKNINASPSFAASSADLAVIAHRLDALEAALVKSGSLRPGEVDSLLKQFRADQTQMAAVPKGITAGPSSEGASKVNGKRKLEEDAVDMDEAEGAALTLEHLAFGRSRVDGAHAIPHFGARAQSSVGRHVGNNNYHLARSSFSHGQSGTKDPGSGSPISSPEVRRKSSLNISSVPGGQGERSSPNRAALIQGAKRDKARQQSTSYGEQISAEEKQLRIDALLDLIGPTDVFELFYRKTDVALRAFTKVLPSTETGRLLVKTVDWLHRCLHVPTFLRQCQDLWELPREAVVYEIALPFVGLYFTVCCLGIQFMDADVAAKHFTPEDVANLPDLYASAARSAMWAADFVANHTMEHLQSLILLGVFMNNRDRSEAAWALLGAAIKMAQGLGLSRLGAEQQAVDGKPLPMWIGRWSSLIQREVGRRVWWNLVFLDWALAPSYNFSSAIQPEQIKTSLPANIDDEDLIDGEPLKAQPISVRTGMSFQLARLKFAEITHKQIWQANLNSRVPYSFVLSVDAELRKAMMDLPAFFQPDTERPAESITTRLDLMSPTDQVRHYEKIMLSVAIHSRMLRLHRPWLAKGYKDEKFAYSKEQCIRAARATLRIMGDTGGTAAFLEKWWLPLFYVSVSGLVVIVDLLRTNKKDMHSDQTEQKISEVKGALNVMRQIADISHPSRAAVKVMSFLLAEVEERKRPGTSRKRKSSASPETEADGERDLQRAVQKLIHLAQLEADSPAHAGHSIDSVSPAVIPTTSSPLGEGQRERVFDAYPAPSAGPFPLVNVSGGMSQQPGLSLPRNQGGRDGSVSDPSVPKIEPPSRQGSGHMPNTAPDMTNGFLGLPNMGGYHGPTSPFTFPVDPATAPASYPAFSTSGPSNALDPAVESILANYFPPPGSNGNGAGGGMMDANTMQGMPNLSQAPEDFLNKVFSFSWENGDGAHMQGFQGHGNGNGNGSGMLDMGMGMPGQQGFQVQQSPMQQQNRQMSGANQQHQQQGQQGQQGHQGQGMGMMGMDAFGAFEWGNNSGGWMA